MGRGMRFIGGSVTEGVGIPSIVVYSSQDVFCRSISTRFNIVAKTNVSSGSSLKSKSIDTARLHVSGCNPFQLCAGSKLCRSVGRSQAYPIYSMHIDHLQDVTSPPD